MKSLDLMLKLKKQSIIIQQLTLDVTNFVLCSNLDSQCYQTKCYQSFIENVHYCTNRQSTQEEEKDEWTKTKEIVGSSKCGNTLLPLINMFDQANTNINNGQTLNDAIINIPLSSLYNAMVNTNDNTVQGLIDTLVNTNNLSN